MEKIIKKLDEKQESSNIVPIWKFIILSVLSFDFYQFYWFYKNWKDIKNNFEEYKDIKPLLRTIGFFIPFWGLYMLYVQFKTIQSKTFCFESKTKILLIIIIYFLFSFFSFLNSPFHLFTALNFIPFILIQDNLNLLWRKNQANYKIKLISIPEMFIIFIGLLIWINEIHYYFIK
jgi:hypothetical protein